MPAVLLDTNLLLLLVAGLTSPSYILKHKNLSAYTARDFETLYALLAEVGFRIATTPNILTETSNLLNQTRDPMKTEMNSSFAAIVAGAHNHRLVECHVPSLDAVQIPAFMWLGLSDAASLEYPDKQVILVTTDGSLFEEALKQKREARFFIRELDHI